MMNAIALCRQPARVPGTLERYVTNVAAPVGLIRALDKVPLKGEYIYWHPRSGALSFDSPIVHIGDERRFLLLVTTTASDAFHED